MTGGQVYASFDLQSVPVGYNAQVYAPRNNDMSSIFKLFHVCRFAVFACALLVAPAEAAIYKWVDENGQTVYSETPPPKGTAATRLKEAPPPPVDPNAAMESLRNRAEAFDERQEERGEQENETQQSTEREKQIQENCERLRNNLEVLTTNNQVREKTGENQYSVLGEEQRQARIKETRERIQKECSN